VRSYSDAKAFETSRDRRRGSHGRRGGSRQRAEEAERRPGLRANAPSLRPLGADLFTPTPMGVKFPRRLQKGLLAFHDVKGRTGRGRRR